MVKSTRFRWCVAALLLLTAGGSIFVGEPPTPERSCKPVAPIDLDAAIVGDPSAPFGVTARASSRTGAEVDLEILLPDGVVHVAGEKRKRGRRCDVSLDLRAKDRSRSEILVRATIADGKAKLTRVVPLVIFDEPPAPSKGRDARDSQGRPVLEFSP